VEEGGGGPLLLPLVLELQRKQALSQQGGSLKSVGLVGVSSGATDGVNGSSHGDEMSSESSRGE